MNHRVEYYGRSRDQARGNGREDERRFGQESGRGEEEWRRGGREDEWRRGGREDEWRSDPQRRFEARRGQEGRHSGGWEGGGFRGSQGRGYPDETYGWESGRGYGGGVDSLSADEGRYPQRGRGEREYGQQRDYGRRDYGRRDYGQGGYGQREFGGRQYGQPDYGRQREPDYARPREPDYRRERESGERGRGQPQYGERDYGQREYGQGDYGRARGQPHFQYQHEQDLFGREPFTYGYEPRYFGTGNPGWGGTGFTGGAYTFGEEAPEIPRTYELEADQGLGYYQAGYYQPGYDPMASEGGSRWSGRGSQGGFSSSQGGFRGGDPRTGPGMFRGRGPKGYQRSDERLREDISERIMQAYHIDSSEVTVEVRGGKVVLEGTVPDRRMKHAIEDLADAAPGVQDIENRIRVQSSASGAGTMSRPVGSATAGSAAGSPGSTGTTGAGSSAAGSGSAGTGSTGAGTSGRTTRKE